MTAQEVLDPANAAEAEMASVAHQCLVMALDHSNADHINIILDMGTHSDEKHELTTQESANFLKRRGWRFKWLARRGLPPFWMPMSCTLN